jgi:hypothetical protein
MGTGWAAAHDRVACSDLASALIPDTTITLAQVNPATANPMDPEHGEVIGSINERTGFDGKPYAIGFHLRMPVAWNGRFFFQEGRRRRRIPRRHPRIDGPGADLDRDARRIFETTDVYTESSQEFMPPPPRT